MRSTTATKLLATGYPRHGIALSSARLWSNASHSVSGGPSEDRSRRFWVAEFIPRQLGRLWLDRGIMTASQSPS